MQWHIPFLFKMSNIYDIQELIIDFAYKLRNTHLPFCITLSAIPKQEMKDSV